VTTAAAAVATCNSVHHASLCAVCALCTEAVVGCSAAGMMIQGTSTDGYASLLVIHAASGGICHLTGQLGTLAHLEHEQAAAVQ
jgi:hypothetical protein